MAVNAKRLVAVGRENVPGKPDLFFFDVALADVPRRVRTRVCDCEHGVRWRGGHPYPCEWCAEGRKLAAYQDSDAWHDEVYAPAESAYLGGHISSTTFTRLIATAPPTTPWERGKAEFALIEAIVFRRYDAEQDARFAAYAAREGALYACTACEDGDEAGPGHTCPDKHIPY